MEYVNKKSILFPIRELFSAPVSSMLMNYFCIPPNIHAYKFDFPLLCHCSSPSLVIINVYRGQYLEGLFEFLKNYSYRKNHFNGSRGSDSGIPSFGTYKHIVTLLITLMLYFSFVLGLVLYAIKK